ncbi:major outer capsid protein [Diaphorina citri reovirus]|nr:major outer capsid protein [Diaphorina citri reovirus]
MERQVNVDVSLLTCGPVSQNDIDIIYTEKQNIRIIENFNYLIREDQILISPNSDRSENAITLYLKEVNIRSFVNLLNSKNLSGKYNLQKFVNDLKNVLSNNITTVEQSLDNQPFISRNMRITIPGFKPVSRMIVSNMDAAYREAVSFDDELSLMMTECDLVLKPYATPNMNSVLDHSYIEKMHKAGFDTDRLINKISTSLSQEYGLFKKENKRAVKPESINCITGVIFPGTSISTRSIMEVPSINDEYNKLVVFPIEVISTLLVGVPISKLVNKFLTTDELKSLNQDVSLIEQNWVASTNVNQSDKDKDIYKKLYKALKLLETNNATKEQNAATVASITEKYSDKVATYTYDVIKDVAGIEECNVLLLDGSLTSVRNYKAISDLLGKVWGRMKSFGSRHPELVQVALRSTIDIFSTIIEKKYGIKTDEIIDFYDNGPGKILSGSGDIYSKMKKVKSLSANILPSLANVMKTTSPKNLYNISEIQNSFGILTDVNDVVEVRNSNPKISVVRFNDH